MTKRFWAWFRVEWEKQDHSNFDTFDPWEWIRGKDTWTPAKKAKYWKTMVKQTVFQRDLMSKAFKVMVKSGEVHSSPVLDLDDEGYLDWVNTLPRSIKIPVDRSCGLLTAIQSLLWSALKKVLPEFFQGDSKESLNERLSEMVLDASKDIAMSLDGSGFDSTQWAELMECVDNEFWEAIKPQITRMCRNAPFFKKYLKRDPDDFAKKIVQSAQWTDNWFFARLPGVNGPRWE
jgi:hypothetical protein